MAQTEINKRKLFVFDCDSTIIQDEVIELIAAEAGSLDLVAEVTERAMRGEIDFEESLRERVATLKGLHKSVFDRVISKVRITPGAEELINKIHSEDGYVAIVSGGFHEVLDSIANTLKADMWMANRLMVQDDHLTGHTTGAVVDSGVKARMLKQWADELGVSLNNTIAVGDGANDIPMMKEAGLSVAFNAKPIVREVADLTVEGDLSRLIKHVY
ncbi:MAG TPA: phosphoserine phosphatase SerB [Microbacteriaceae bacterium]|nr:phosphoserine phosphatase SerB [Microbacteriaceae bacterium]